MFRLHAREGKAIPRKNPKAKKGLFLKNSGHNIIRSTTRISLPVTALRTSLSSTNQFLREIGLGNILHFFPIFSPLFIFLLVLLR